MPRAPEVRIQDGSHLLGTRKPHKSTLAALGQAMPAPLGTGPRPRNLNRAWAQLTLPSSLLGHEKGRGRRKEREGQEASTISRICQLILKDPWGSRHHSASRSREPFCLQLLKAVALGKLGHMVSSLILAFRGRNKQKRQPVCPRGWGH